MEVYIIFGDISRSDGENIWGVFDNITVAKNALKRFEIINPDTYYHIERFDVGDYIVGSRTTLGRKVWKILFNRKDSIRIDIFAIIGAVHVMMEKRVVLQKSILWIYVMLMMLGF